MEPCLRKESRQERVISYHESFLNYHVLVKREQELYASWRMKVGKGEFIWEFSQLSRPGQRRTQVAWELLRVEK